METFDAVFQSKMSIPFILLMASTFIPFCVAMLWVSVNANSSKPRLLFSGGILGISLPFLFAFFAVSDKPFVSTEMAPASVADISDAAVERFGEDVHDRVFEDGNERFQSLYGYDPETQEFSGEIYLIEGNVVNAYDITVQLDGTTTFEEAETGAQ